MRACFTGRVTGRHAFRVMIEDVCSLEVGRSEYSIWGYVTSKYRSHVLHRL